MCHFSRLANSLRASTSFFVAARHKRTVPSQLAVARVMPSGEKATVLILKVSFGPWLSVSKGRVLDEEWNREKLREKRQKRATARSLHSCIPLGLAHNEKTHSESTRSMPRCVQGKREIHAILSR
jgi:hypothetical protein